MNKKSYLLGVGLLALLCTISIADPDPSPSTPTECPGDSTFACDGAKLAVGLPFFACSGALYHYPDGTPLSICCQYEAQQYACVRPFPLEITYGCDLKLKMTRAPAVCVSTPTGQSCEPVILP